METEPILQIVAGALTLCLGRAGMVYRKYKGKWDELVDVIKAVDEAIEDDRITRAELKKILKEVSDLK